MATPTSLPASFTTGQVLTAAQMNNLRGAFRVLQVVSGSTNTAVANATSTLVDTGLSATITPSATSSKILVMVHQAGCYKSAGNLNNALRLVLLRGSTIQLYLVDGGGYTATALLNNFGSVSCSYLDSPNTTSATTYKTQLSNVGIAAAEVGVQMNFNTTPSSTITLMEISA